MVNYNNAKIYKIVDNTNGNIYIGSTCEPTLARRLAAHVCNYKSYLKNNENKYMSSYEILKNNNYDIVLIENVNCNTKDTLHKRERFFIENNDCVNIVKRPYATNEEKKEKMVISQKKYADNNKEKMADSKKKYSEKNNIYLQQKHVCIICGGLYNNHHYTTHNKTLKHIKYLNENLCIFKLFE